MPKLEIVYFPIKGRAEAARLLLHMGDVEFTNTELREEFQEKKAAGTYLYSQIPILNVDDAQFAQSSAIIRYCAQAAGLVPESPLGVLAADEYLSVCDEFLIKYPFAYKVGEENAKEESEKFFKEQMPRLMGGMERAVTERKDKDDDSPWLVGNQITYADIVVYALLDDFKKGVIRYIPDDFLDPYPKIYKVWKAIDEHPKIVEWNKTHKYGFP